MSADKPIPDETLTAACLVADKWGFDQRHADELAADIALAIMAAEDRQQEKDAKIADEHARALRKAWSNDCARAVEGVATAIRNGG